jgi:hypothetical protein
VPDLAHDVVAEFSGLRLSGQGHDTFLDGHSEGCRVGEELIQDHVPDDFAADICVRAVEHR